MTTTKMNLGEFIREGYLLEVNRRFLHPLGLALYVVAKHQPDGTVVADPKECGCVEMGVLDARQDPEGFVMEDLTDGASQQKHRNIERLWHERTAARLKRLGWHVQPPNSKAPTPAVMSVGDDDEES